MHSELYLGTGHSELNDFWSIEIKLYKQMKHYIFGEYALYIMESKMETTQTICTIVALLLIYSRKCKEKKDLEVAALSSLHATPPQPSF